MMEGGAIPDRVRGALLRDGFYPVIGVVAFAALMIGFNPARISGG